MYLPKNNLRISGFTLLKRKLNVSPADLVNRYRFIALVLNLLLTLNTIYAQYGGFAVYAICKISTTSDGLQLANCSGPYDNIPGYTVKKKILIPADLPSSIEVLDLSNEGGLKISGIYFVSETFDNTVLNNYPKLKRIIQRNSKQWPTEEEADENPIQEFWDARGQKALLKGFAILQSLEYFEFSGSNLNNRWYPIIFPKSLKTLNLNGNLLSSLNLIMCPELEDVNVNWNKRLEFAPTFHIPVPPIKTLRMRGCPLTKMTILDIAPLCELTILELEFPADSYYVTEKGYCQCVILKRWIDQVKLKGAENVKCKEPSSKPACSESILKEAEGLRKKCPLLKAGDTTSKQAFSILKYIFFSILFLLLLVTLILYIIRHFHLKEWWAAHHAGLVTATSAKMEEEEGSLENQPSLSDYSVSSF